MLKILWRQKGNIIKIYKLDGCEWNWFLNDYYPKAHLLLEVEKIGKNRTD